MSPARVAGLKSKSLDYQLMLDVMFEQSIRCRG